MKLDSAHSFYQNLKLNQEHLKFVGLSGQTHEELLSLLEFFKTQGAKKWELPEALSQLSQLSLFCSEPVQCIVHLEKLKKKDLESFLQCATSFQGLSFVLSTTATNMQALYNLVKNDMLWLDLSSEKPWQKKDRLCFLVQQEAKNQGFLIDKQATSYLLDNEQLKLERAKLRLESLMILAKGEKKITLEMVQSLLPPIHKEIDFAWIDQLLFKKEPLDMPLCQDATDVLLFLGQLRYALQGALKLKVLQHKGYNLEQIKEYFPKSSPQALSFQIKKADEVSFEFCEKALMIVYQKELDLKADFHQPASVFIELVTKLEELKTKSFR